MTVTRARGLLAAGLCLLTMGCQRPAPPTPPPARLLAAAGWLVVRVWEHEDPEPAAARIAHAVRGR